jgi:hypothetical protein
MRFESGLNPDEWAKDRYEWAAVGLLMIPLVVIVLALSALGAGYGVVLGVVIVVGVPASGWRKTLAAKLRGWRRR